MAASRSFGRLYRSCSSRSKDCASFICFKVLAGRDFEAALSWPPKIPPAPRRSSGGSGRHRCWAVVAGSCAVESLGLISVLCSGRFTERGCHVFLRRCAAEGTRCFSEAKGLLPLRTFVPKKMCLRGWELRTNEIRPDRNARFWP